MTRTEERWEDYWLQKFSDGKSTFRALTDDPWSDLPEYMKEHLKEDAARMLTWKEHRNDPDFSIAHFGGAKDV